MTSAQRYWLVCFLFVFAAVLTVYHFEWTELEGTVTLSREGRFDYPSEERLVLPVYETYRKIGLSDQPNAEIASVHGVYVRRSRSVTQGVIFGGLLPLVLIGLAGFIAFGKRKASA